MPPLYSWKCEQCQKEVDILRPFSDYADSPTVDEAGTCGEADERRGAQLHAWTKRIRAPRVERGPNWKTSKGNH
jgi:hypothetical protein